VVGEETREEAGGHGGCSGESGGKGGFQMIQWLDSDLGLCRLILIATSRIMSD